MDEKNENIKYLIIHTHFYQPPRENPYSGEIEIDYTSKPYENWNHRISMECYFPNLYSRIYDNNNEIIEIVNNYKYYNLNFGPTLLSWLENKYPYYYLKIKETFFENKNNIKNFIAQAYNHTILPLDPFMDKMIQIKWGIKDFENRFDQKPIGMWLGECAVNEDVLKILIDNNIKYTILSPHQIKTAIDPTTNKLKQIIPNMIYRWYDKNQNKEIIESRFIDIIVYDDVISKKIAFNNITLNSEIFSKELLSRYQELKTNIIVIALDGETFGHHIKFSDLTLAHAFKYEFQKNNIKVISAYQYLSNFPIYAICELAEGPDKIGTSWSCEHGVRRWMGGCPCGDEGKYSTEWRKGLRIAIDWLSEIVNEIFNEEGKKIFLNHIEALKEYIDVINKKIHLKSFLSKHLIKNDNQTAEKALNILEMFRYKMLSRTSCGWFFNDISRIETQTIIRYAIKTCELAENLGYKGIEKGFVSLLEMAPSNFNEFKNGKVVYEKLIKPTKVDENKAILYLTIKAALSNRKTYSNAIYLVNILDLRYTDNYSIIEITAEIEKKDIFQKSFLIKLDLISIENIKFLLKADDLSEEFKIYEFSPPIQIEILKMILTFKKIQKIKEMEDVLNSILETATIYPAMVYENLYEDINYFFKSLTEIYLIMFIKESNISYLRRINYFIERLEKIGFKTTLEPSNDVIILMPDFVEKISSNIFSLQEINEMEKIFKRLSLHHFYFHTQNYLYEMKIKTRTNPS